MLNPTKTGETCIRRFDWMGHPSSKPARIEVGSMLASMHEYAEKEKTRMPFGDPGIKSW